MKSPFDIFLHKLFNQFDLMESGKRRRASKIIASSFRNQFLSIRDLTSSYSWSGSSVHTAFIYSTFNSIFILTTISDNIHLITLHQI